MGWNLKVFGKSIIEMRSGNTGTIENPGSDLSFLGNSSSSGVSVTEETSITYQPVFSCVKVLSEALASMPFKAYKIDGRAKEIAYSTNAHQLLAIQPNSLMTPFVFKDMMMATALLWGNAYALKRYGADGVNELEYIHPSKVTVLVNKTTRQLFYQVTDDGINHIFDSSDMIHIRGFGDQYVGKSVIRMQMESVGLGMAATEISAEFFNNGAVVSGMLSTEGNLTKEQRRLNRENWQNAHSGQGNRQKVAVLSGGTKYTRIGIPPGEGQFIESRKYSANEIAGIFKVPPFMIAAGENKFKDIQELNTWFYTNALLPWIIRFEEEFNRKIFSMNEMLSGKYFTKMNANAILRANIDARAKWYKEMYNMGVYSINDIREREDENPIPDGDLHYIAANNMVPIAKQTEYIDAKIQALTKNIQKST